MWARQLADDTAALSAVPLSGALSEVCFDGEPRLCCNERDVSVGSEADTAGWSALRQKRTFGLVPLKPNRVLHGGTLQPSRVRTLPGQSSAMRVPVAPLSSRFRWKLAS